MSMKNRMIFVFKDKAGISLLFVLGMMMMLLAVSLLYL